MNRRTALVLLTLPVGPLLRIHAAQVVQVGDQWEKLAEAWNPWATKLNAGVMDLKLLGRVKKALRDCGMCER